MAAAGDILVVDIEKPVAGGRMLARADGQVVLVSGAIPGERVSVRIESVRKGVAYAETREVERASQHRREPFTDPMCGGCLYAHIAPEGQLPIKAAIIADAFARIARLGLPESVGVAASPDGGYRMRARLHVSNGRIGWFREGTHEVCDLRGTRQLLPATCDVIEQLAAALGSDLEDVRELEVSENCDATERVVHLDAEQRTTGDGLASFLVEGLTGVTVTRSAAGLEVLAGSPYVTDVTTVEAQAVPLRRHVLSFFQGNRYLLADLAAYVVSQIEGGAHVLDLYAGVGLFALSAAVCRQARVIAVESDWHAAGDLKANVASLTGDRGELRAVRSTVEIFAMPAGRRPDVVVVDPPRTGMSRGALDRVVSVNAPRIVYVSCDVATLARDCRRFLDAGYALGTIRAFDLFPNTPHVETVVVLDRPST